MDARLRAADEKAAVQVRALSRQLLDGWVKLHNALLDRSVSNDLTVREREVAKLAAFGLSNKEIAGRLSISLSAVKQAIRLAMDKTHARSLRYIYSKKTSRMAGLFAQILYFFGRFGILQMAAFSDILMVGKRGVAMNRQTHEEGELYKVITVAEHTFTIRYGYYEEYERAHSEPMAVFPNFEAAPCYTSSGYPLATRIQDKCPYFRSRSGVDNGWCADCAYYPDEWAEIAVCHCEERRILRTCEECKCEESKTGGV